MKSVAQRVMLIRNIHLNAFGGAETYQLALATELKKDKYDPIIISSSRPLRIASQAQGIKSIPGFYLPHQNWSGYRNLFLPLYFLWQILLFFWYLIIIAKYHPHILQIQNRDDMLAGTLAGHLTHTRVIWTDHADLRKVVWENLNVKYKNPIGKLIYKIAPLAYKITTISDYEYQYLQKLTHHRLQNLIVIKNGAIDQKSAYAKIKPQAQSLCFIGRIVEEKGIKELIDAFNQVSPKYPKATLNLYGDGADLPLFKAYAKKNPQIKFCGPTTRPLKALVESHIFILPSYHEGLSLSLLDAAMMQKAIIATNVDGNPEIVKDKKTGILVPAKNPKALATAIDKLLSDPTLAQKYAKNARALYQKEFDFSTIVKNQMEVLYHEKN